MIAAPKLALNVIRFEEEKKYETQSLMNFHACLLPYSVRLQRTRLQNDRFLSIFLTSTLQNVTGKLPTA